jgi:hypothetical protein
MDEFMTYGDISQAFLDHLDESGLEGMSYGNFWRVLDERGARIQGRNGKVQRDRVYRALSLDARIEKLKPGFFSTKPR